MDPCTVSGRIIAQCPSISHDSKRIYTAVGEEVFVYSLATCQLVEIFECNAKVRGVVQSPWGPELFSFGLKGIQKWSPKGVCLESVLEGENVVAVALPKERANVALVCLENKVVYVDLLKGEVIKTPLERACRDISTTSNGRIFAVSDAKDLIVYSEDLGTHRVFPNNGPSITAVTVTEEYVATGDAAGRIVLWYVLDQVGASAPPKTALKHWHYHGVTSLAQCGNYLAAVGYEGVLTLWNVSSGDMQTIPRFGSAIHHVAPSPNGKWLVLALATNALRLFNVHNAKKGKTIAAVIANFNKGPHMRRLTTVPAGLNSTAVCVNSGLELQFFDTESRHQQSVLAVTPRNYIYESLKDGSLWYTDHVAFTTGALAMATLESRESSALRKLDPAAATRRSQLKFWRKEAGEYVMDTACWDPHSADVTFLIGCGDMFVTGAADGEFRTWAFEDGLWRTIAVANWRGAKITSAAALADGSLLALGHKGHVTLWVPKDNVELQTLPAKSPSQLELCVAHDRVFLLLREAESVVVYDLATLAIVSEIKATKALRRIAVGPGSDPAIVIAESNRLRVFQIAANGKKGKAEVVLKTEEATDVVDLAFVAGERTVEVVLMHQGQRVSVASLDGEKRLKKVVEEETKTSKTAYERAFAAMTKKVAVAETTTFAKPVAMGPHEELLRKEVVPLEARSHQLPPASSLFHSFLRTFGVAAEKDDVNGARYADSAAADKEADGEENLASDELTTKFMAPDWAANLVAALGQ